MSRKRFKIPFSFNLKKTRLNGGIYDFRVYYDTIAVNDILGIHKYFMKIYSMI